MFELERLELILNHLREKQTASVRTLAARLYVSEATVRRDLNELERRGLVRRLHGGVMLVEGAIHELPLVMREQQHVDAKQRIAQQAVRYLHDGQTLFLDASSTVMSIVRHLEGFRDLTVITNGQHTARQLSMLSHKVYCTGGLLLHNSFAYIGEYAIEFVRRFNADICFFSSRGISEDGRITDAHGEETQVRKAMMEQSRMRIFLCDHSKVGPVYSYNLCHVSQIDHWISDR